MPLHPQARAFLDQQIAMGSRPTHELPVDQARQQAIAQIVLQGKGEPVAQVMDYAVPVANGTIPVRVYTPSNETALPILVYFHGGGWVVGNLDTNDVRCRALANGAQCIVVSVNYRHAPEFKFPVAAEDAYAATQWAAEKAESLRGDPTRITVSGVSAGGNLAAVVALMARDRKSPALMYQLLIVPVINYAFDTRSYIENAEGYGLMRVSMQWFWSQYLATASDGTHPYASPIRAESVAHLPPAHVLLAEYDPLHDEGLAYATRLARSSVPTTVTECEGMIHGFWGSRALEVIAQDLRQVQKKISLPTHSHRRVISADGRLVEKTWHELL